MNVFGQKSTLYLSQSRMRAIALVFLIISSLLALFSLRARLPARETGLLCALRRFYTASHWRTTMSKAHLCQRRSGHDRGWLCQFASKCGHLEERVLGASIEANFIVGSQVRLHRVTNACPQAYFGMILARISGGFRILNRIRLWAVVAHGKRGGGSCSLGWPW